jgi:hypothetical protein
VVVLVPTVVVLVVRPQEKIQQKELFKAEKKAEEERRRRQKREEEGASSWWRVLFCVYFVWLVSPSSSLRLFFLCLAYWLMTSLGNKPGSQPAKRTTGGYAPCAACVVPFCDDRRARAPTRTHACAHAHAHAHAHTHTYTRTRTYALAHARDRAMLARSLAVGRPSLPLHVGNISDEEKERVVERPGTAGAVREIVKGATFLRQMV